MARITGVGAYVPPNVVLNEDLQHVRGVDPVWTKEFLNIEERRIVGDDATVVDLACEASLIAIESAGLFPDQIDGTIFGTSTPPQQSPAAACFLQEMLGTKGMAFDLSAACAGFVYGLIVAGQMIESGIHKNVLVVGADAYSKVTNWTDRNCVFFGDGAGAVVVSGSPESGDLFCVAYGSDGSGADAWYIKDGWWGMDGKRVYELAVRYIVQGVRDVLSINNIEPDIVIPHQPGIGILKDAAKELDIPFEKFHTVMDKYANTAAASVPIALHDALLQGKIRSGDNVLLTTVGAGWVWASCILKWV